MGPLFELEPTTVAAYLQRADPVLGRLIERVGPFALTRAAARSTFHAVARAIVYQQLSGKAAATIFARLEGLYPGGRLAAPATVSRTAIPRLRAAGLSQAKALAVQDLARRCSAGTVPSLARLARMDDEAVVECLTEVRGVGVWTAQMLLMFRLGRADVLPLGDFGVRKGFALAFRRRELPTPAALARHAERWRPYRSVASWYLWRAVDLASPAPRS